VTERHGTQAHVVLDEFIPVGIPRVGASAAHDESWRLERELIVALGIGMGAARDSPVSALGEFAAARKMPAAEAPAQVSVR
jgi:hypothetical protein